MLVWPRKKGELSQFVRWLTLTHPQRWLQAGVARDRSRSPRRPLTANDVFERPIIRRSAGPCTAAGTEVKTVHKDSLQRGGPVGYPIYQAASFFKEEKNAMRLMVIEDQVDCAAVLEKRLALEGHEVRVCHNGCSALLDAPEFEPDAILLDIGLPGMDGWQLAPLLRDALVDKQVILIAISGYQTEKDFLRSRAAGIDHHLTKPNYFQQLTEILKQRPSPS